MLVPFTKFNGAGNDFILIDNRKLGIELTSKQAIRICNRQKCIGADGILLVIECISGKADFAWQFLQCDGDTANMCGNGARCFVRFVHEILGHKEPITFETGAGVISAFAQGDNISIQLPTPTQFILNAPLSPPCEAHIYVHSVNTGVPHAVLFVPSVDAVDIFVRGKEIRYHDHFAPNGTNVNFVEIIGPNLLKVRSYERGVEGETLACGTGVAAAALVAAKLHGFTSPVSISVQSGATLTISFDIINDVFEHVYLSGPAEATFTGVLKLE